MKRKLFLSCLLVVVLLYCYRFFLQDSDTVPPLFEEEGSYYITGRICQKDTFYFYLDDIQISSVHPGDTNLSPTISNQKKAYRLQCTYPDAALCIGETILVRGTLSSFAAATNPGQFDTAAYYKSKNVLGKIRNPVLLFRDGKRQNLTEGLWQIRHFLSLRIESLYGEETGVLEAILLGEKSNLESEQKGLYRRNGILHIFSISGLHISFLGMGMFELLRRLGLSRRSASVPSSIVLLLYGIMTGGSISAIRAIGMFLLRMVAIWVGRTPDTLTSLGVMAVFIGITEPGCFQSSGFYFSFGAVVGLCIFGPVLKDMVEGWKGPKGWTKKLILLSLPSISVMLVSIPIQAWFYYEIPVWSILLNMVVVPAMSLLFGSAMLGLLPGLLPARWLVKGIVFSMNFLCQLVEGIPYHMWRIGKPALWQLILYYGVLFGSWFLWKNIRRRKCHLFRRGMKIVLPVLLMLAVLGWRGKSDLQITFLDVGQGQCTLVQTWDGKQYLFDCGSSSLKSVGERILIPYLNYNGISELEKVCISHIDSDHVNGIMELFQLAAGEGIRIREVVLPAQSENQEALFEAILQYREADNRLVVSRAYAGESLVEEGIQIDFLNPPDPNRTKTAGWSDNELSQAMYLTVQNRQGKERYILLLGDVEKRGEEAVIEMLERRGLKQLDVLQVAHHGSGGATSQSLLDCLEGKVAVISCAMKNSYGHPNARLTLRLEQAGYRILETRKAGAVILRL